MTKRKKQQRSRLSTLSVSFILPCFIYGPKLIKVRYFPFFLVKNGLMEMARAPSHLKSNLKIVIINPVP
jgi:hypothetical protein